MIKKILTGIVIIAGFTSCNEDFSDWLNPQSNAQGELANEVLALQPTLASIDFAKEKGDSIQMFTTALKPSSVELYDVVITGDTEDKTCTLTASPEGKVSVADLNKAVTSMYGLAPKTRDCVASVSTNAKVATVDGVVVAYMKAEPFKFTATPDAPVIEDAYYYIGSLGTGTAYPLSNGGGDVYENPVFSVVVPAGQAGDWHWFKIAPASAIKDGSIDWGLEGTCLCAPAKDDTSMSGNYVIGGDKYSWHLVETDYPSAAYFRLAFNLLEGTYTVEPIAGVAEYYMVGRQNNWSLSTVSACYPTSNTSVSYTSYFTGACDCRISNMEQISTGNWNNYGSEDETSTCTKLVANTGKCIISPSAGYYTLNVDFGTMTYSWTPIDGTPASYATIGLIGVNGDWNNDVVLTKVEGSGDLNGADTHNWTGEVTITSECKVKFRANSSWDINWGTDNATLSKGYVYGTGYQNGSDIPTMIGTYNVYFNDITGQFFFVEK